MITKKKMNEVLDNLYEVNYICRDWISCKITTIKLNLPKYVDFDFDDIDIPLFETENLIEMYIKQKNADLGLIDEIEYMIGVLRETRQVIHDLSFGREKRVIHMFEDLAWESWIKATNDIEQKLGFGYGDDLFKGIDYFNPELLGEQCEDDNVGLAYYNTNMHGDDSIYICISAVINYHKETLVKILQHEIIHHMCNKLFGFYLGYCDNSCVFSAMVMFANKQLGYSLNNSFLHSIGLNDDYYDIFKQNHPKLFKKAIDGRTTKYSMIRYIWDYLDNLPYDENDDPDSRINQIMLKR